MFFYKICWWDYLDSKFGVLPANRLVILNQNIAVFPSQQVNLFFWERYEVA